MSFFNPGRTLAEKIVPTQCKINTVGSISANGSSNDDNCTSPNSSILFDGSIPTLTGLNGDIWASQLLIIQTALSVYISFDFNHVQSFSGMGRVEIVMFNCPEWGFASDTITILSGNSLDLTQHDVIHSITPTVTSCNSLVRVCMLYFICNSTVLGLQFRNPSVHLAEVTFYHNNYSTTCPPDAIIEGPTTQAANDVTDSTLTLMTSDQQGKIAVA